MRHKRAHLQAETPLNALSRFAEPPLALAPTPALAKGCLRGAAAGGVAGHFAHHHAVMGAMAGCAAGHVY